MLWDHENKFSTHQAVTATAVSENVIKVPAGDIGKGRPVYVQVMGGLYTGSGSITVEVQTDDTDTMAGASTITAFTIDNATLLRGGSLLVAAIPTGAKDFLRLNYVVTGGLSGGNLSAGLVLAGQTAV